MPVIPDCHGSVHCPSGSHVGLLQAGQHVLGVRDLVERQLLQPLERAQPNRNQLVGVMTSRSMDLPAESWRLDLGEVLVVVVDVFAVGGFNPGGGFEERTPSPRRCRSASSRCERPWRCRFRRRHRTRRAALARACPPRPLHPSRRGTGGGTGPTGERTPTGWLRPRTMERRVIVRPRWFGERVLGHRWLGVVRRRRWERGGLRHRASSPGHDPRDRDSRRRRDRDGLRAAHRLTCEGHSG